MFGVGYAANAAVRAATPATTVNGCIVGTSRVMENAFTNSQPDCGSSTPFSLAKGATGAQGPAGPAGPQGPSGVVSTVTDDLGGIASVPTGGSFATNATEAGTIALKAGTYLITLNAKATPPAAGTGAVSVFPQFFVYNTTANAAFTGDLFNVGSGALEDGANSQIDSYYSGTATITLTADTTLHAYAFGYDSDRGAGSYVLDDLSVTATQITAGS